MKKITKRNQILVVSISLVLVFSASCKKEKDKQIPPVMNFKTSSGYTSADAMLSTNDTIKVGITAEKSEDKDLLTKFVETQQYDAGSITTVTNESFNNDTYSKDMTIITRNVAGTEVYTFTIINRDGITTTKKITLTVM
jgi:hypothetical protein